MSTLRRVQGLIVACTIRPHYSLTTGRGAHYQTPKTIWFDVTLLVPEEVASTLKAEDKVYLGDYPYEFRIFSITGSAFNTQGHWIHGEARLTLQQARDAPVFPPTWPQ